MSVSRFLEKHFGGLQRIDEPAVKSITTEAPILKTRSLTFEIFTDGACTDNGKKNAKGGYGVHFYSLKGQGDVSRPLFPQENQTNNRAELRAIQSAMDYIDKNKNTILAEYDQIRIWSDSEYSIHCLTKWAPGWRRNGWKKRDGSPVLNLDLIRSILDRLQLNHQVTLQHVRAHQDSKQNEFPWSGNKVADELATRGIHSL